MVLVQQEESRSDTKFEAIAMVRADIAIYFPFKPFCMYSFSEPRRVRDWFYLAPRDKADFIYSGAYDQFYGCKKELRMGANVDEYIAPYIGAVQEDGNLPIMITRMDQRGFPNNMCDRFRSPGALSFDPNPEHNLCGLMTYQNKYNTLDEVEQPIPPAAHMVCAAKSKAVAVCLHGPAELLTKPLVRRSHRRHLIHMMGPRVTTFLHVAQSAAMPKQQLEGLAQQLGVAPRHVRSVQAGAAESSSDWCAQAVHLNGCLELITAEEQASKSTFNVVVLVRSDTVVFAPFKPMCMYNFKKPRYKEAGLYMLSHGDAEDFQQKLAKLVGSCQKNGAKATFDEDWDWSLGFEKDKNLPIVTLREASKSICDKSSRNLGAMRFDPKWNDGLCEAMTSAARS